MTCLLKLFSILFYIAGNRNFALLQLNRLPSGGPFRFYGTGTYTGGSSHFRSSTTGTLQRQYSLSLPVSRIENAPSLDTEYLTAEDGLPMHLVVSSRSVNPKKPPVLFIHGSFHSSWCWEENFIPSFAQKGYECYAASLRGTHGMS